MAEEFKNSSEILRLLGSNKRLHIGNSAQEIRNLVHSLKNPYGSIYRTGSIQDTNISVSGTYVKADINTGLNSGYLVTSPTDNRLTYVGDKKRHFHIACTISMSASAGGITSALAIAKNDTILDHSVNKRYISGAIDVGAAALHADIMLSKNDYIELWVANETSTANITIEEVYLFMMGMFI